MITINEINQKIIDERENLSGFGCVHQSTGGVVRYKNAKQWFAIDGGLAWDVTPHEFTDDDGSLHRFTPIVVGGSTFHSCPDEGKSGMLTLWEYKNFKNRPDGYRLIWGPARWIRTAEIDQTPDEIWKNIADEINAGHNVFFTPLPGWV
jgi:hypothetical protein